MGYDMSLLTTPKGDSGYFRLNVWAMDRYRGAMRQLGMIYSTDSSQAAWPEWNRYPDDRQRQDWFEAANEHHEYDEVLPDGIPDDILAESRAYIAASMSARRYHPGGGNVIPSHKFESNDGWIVTPDEIRAALAAYEAEQNRNETLSELASAGSARDYWDSWIDYLRRAVDFGGFAVN